MQPLSPALAFRTSDAEEFEHRLLTEFGVTEIDLPDPATLKFRNNVVRLHDLSLSFWTFGTPVRIGFAESAVAALGLPVKGRGITSSGTRSVPVSVGDPVLVSAGRLAEFQYGADLEKLVVCVEQEALKRKLSVLLGAPVSRKIEFDLTSFVSEEMLTGLLGLIDALMGAFDDRRNLLSSLAVRQLEKAVVAQLLLTACHQFSDQLQHPPPETSSEHIKRAEEFIEANWNQLITMEALTEITGVSARTLFRTFEKLKGYSPMAFARKIKLERAHALLRQPGDATTVTGVALACGFSNPGRFANDYWEMFGELPSETLRRSCRNR
jgi:AraC-like DNA-binding protein